MQNDSPIWDDPGTILDSFVSVPKVAPAKRAGSPVPAARPIAPAPVSDEVLYRSIHRWTAPRILICDDGSLDDGETVYLRSEKIVIGRSKGDIVIGHDVAMSGSHAEIARRDVGGNHVWVLRDLGSSNGTLVRVSTLTLKPEAIVQLGSRRFRFEVPGSTQPGVSPSGEQRTVLLSSFSDLPADILPALVESGRQSGESVTRHPFRSTRVKIGRPRCGNDIELDDFCLAGCHATVSRDVSGAWQLKSEPSLNGVWVGVDMVTLTDNCMFQCGEQRFRFLL